MKTIQSCNISEIERWTLDRVTEIIRKHIPDSRIILYGSRARGEGREDSDYDLLVITENKIPYQIDDLIHGEIYEALFQTQQWVSVFIMDRATWENPISQGSPFYEEIGQDGIQL